MSLPAQDNTDFMPILSLNLALVLNPNEVLLAGVSKNNLFNGVICFLPAASGYCTVTCVFNALIIDYFSSSPPRGLYRIRDAKSRLKKYYIRYNTSYLSIRTFLMHGGFGNEALRTQLQIKCLNLRLPRTSRCLHEGRLSPPNR